MTDFTKIVQSYSEHGLSCLPTKADKSPASPANWKNGFNNHAFNDCHGIGIICGAKSGSLECFDFDNHAGDATINLAKYLDIPEVKEIYEKHKFPIEKTISGGYHILIRCEHVEGNRKLASKLLNGKPDCFIETRGEGGYFCADPTPGYTVVRNDILNVPTVSKIERAVLFDNAISMNEYFPSLKTEFEQTDRPGDLYNASSVAIGEMKSNLQGIGWQEVGVHIWRRPGKKDGISATLGKVAPNVFYVFTANGYPFEPNKAYTPFQVLGLVKYNGDFKEAAKSIAPEREQRQPIPGKMQLSEIEKILLGARIDTRKHIEKPPTILSIKEQNGTQFQYNRVLTLGNFSCIIGKAKSKKTFFISLITAALLSNDDKGKFIGEMPANKNEILYFDTEQGEYDSYNVIRRIETMSGTGLRLRGYNLRPFSPLERCQIIEHAFKLFGEKTGYCVIDGIADLANGINDEEEATRVTTILLRLSKVYNCHISTVIHQNKNDSFATGHLGSSIMKKAEIIISVSRREGSISEIKCDMSRGISFNEFNMTINGNGFPEVTGSTKDAKIEAYASIYESESKTVDEIAF